MMRRGLAKSGRCAVQAVVFALWLLCAFAAVAGPVKRPVKRPAVKARAEKKTAGGKTARHGSAKPKSAPKTKARRHKPKADDMDFEPPVVQRTRARSAAKVPPRGVAAQGLAAMPPTNMRAMVGRASVVGTAAVSANPPLPSAYSVVGADDDAGEVSEAMPGVAARVMPPPATRSELADEAVEPMVLPGLYSRTGRLVMPAALKGSREVLVHQNVMADAAGLDRIEDDEDLARLRRLHLLVDFPASASLRVNPELNEGRRCARPWTVTFAVDAARQFSARFHQPLQVNSAVRTVAYQRRLQRTNGNAAAVAGETASPHLTGQAIDFGKRGMTAAEIAWMRAYLLPLMRAGKVDVEEEFQQACFHVSVYKSYVSGARKVGPKGVVPKNQVAQVRPPRVGRSGE